MRSHCSPGKKLGDVYYFSPEGIKFRSSKQVAIFCKSLNSSLLVNHHVQLFTILPVPKADPHSNVHVLYCLTDSE